MLHNAFLAGGHIALDLLGRDEVAASWDGPSVLDHMTVGMLPARAYAENHQRLLIEGAVSLTAHFHTVSGLSTPGFGVIRTSVGGNVALSDITLGDPEGNEILHDTIGKNLICTNLFPAP